MTAPAPTRPPALVRHTVSLLGARVDAATMDGVMQRVEQMVAGSGAHQIVTLDALGLLRVQRDAGYRDVVNGASLVLPDGAGVVWAARMLGTPVPARVPGVELVSRLCALAAVRSYRVYFLGAAPGVPEAAAGTLAKRYPGLIVAGAHHGFFSPAEETAVVEAVRAARPHVLFVALGVPRQDLWIARYRETLGVPVSVGVGGSFDVYAGRLRRAPRWMQQAGLEWLFRVLQEPWRWRRVAGIPPFVLLVLRERMRRRKGMKV